LGRVLDRVNGFDGLLWAILRGEGERDTHPYFMGFVVLAVLPIPRLRKKIYAKSRVMHHRGKLAIYILTRLLAMGVCAQRLLHGFQKMAKLRQKQFVKIDNAKIAISGQILRGGY
jgi:hypothetical protein